MGFEQQSFSSGQFLPIWSIILYREIQVFNIFFYFTNKIFTKKVRRSSILKEEARTLETILFADIHKVSFKFSFTDGQNIKPLIINFKDVKYGFPLHLHET